MASFIAPEASAALCEDVPFDSASDTAIDNKAAFDAFDQTLQGKNDPSQCKALLAFPDGTIFWSSKMAIDADGPAAGVGRLSGSQLDPDTGQNDTTLHFPDTNEGLPSEAVPYIVLPGATFRTNTGLAIGDVALVIFKDKIAAAVCGDIGPSKKIGEGSIRLHEPCIRLRQIRVRCVSLTGVVSVSLTPALKRTFYSSYSQNPVSARN